MSNRISLCMIVGNVSEYIERCLISFLPVADEVVLVRAIGKQEPDATFDIAKRLCEEAGKPLITGEYSNSPGHEDWPHIDSFAAARQMSFDLATGTYCFWCDSDDILEPGSAEIARELAQRGGYPVFMFPYRIFGRGLNLPRERMILKTAGKWRYAVHECFTFKIEPAQGIQDDRVVVTHLPHPTKTGSNERNLRILKSIPDEELNTGLRYHLHVELLLAGDIEGGVKQAEKVLAQPDLGKAERYELFLNLAMVDPDPNRKEQLLLASYGSDPTRREALAMLAINALNMGKNDMGLAYARQMAATPAPKVTAWNHREALYGWVGDDIYAQGLRACGMLTGAETIRKNALHNAGGPRIALVHATRGRPEQAAKARKLWLDTADKPDRIEHIFCIDADDRESDSLRRMHHVEVASVGCVAAWNIGAFSTVAPIIIQLSDDWTPPAKWDELIIERFKQAGGDDFDKKPLVLAIGDGLRTDSLLCMSIITRKYWEQDFFMFHPWFKSMYCDNWFTELAYERGQVIEARDLIFSHDHPLKTGAPMDKTYAESNAPDRYRQGAALIELLRRREDWSAVPGWFNYWPLYQNFAQRIQDGDTVCEIGVWMGRSIIFLAQELQRLGKDKVKILAVDTFKGESEQPEHQTIVTQHGGSIRAAFEANIQKCGVAYMIEIIEGDSAESAAKVADGSLSFCYVDAAHDYVSVKRDLDAWVPKMAKDGLMAGHDAQHEPVAKAAREKFGEIGVAIVGPVWIRKNI